ncbi:heparinase II/III family protein [Methylobacterium brachythecii]|uniref:Heparin-sulfate lyase N-terminal domain-containing protein n=1 Tax=Methylobacterium brachythecii TaxID=1176177 RepID=A0A7W6F691_9HYPH|nr:alginate lyase family protein [Methylobacterium brachythecii]MBB3902119.1 hypothetical protein [Methylobacterium brachythecii]GLS44516.1 hypothetical protein GCM10007884_25040 [Methylobacterium brachythecii]
MRSVPMEGAAPTALMAVVSRLGRLRWYAARVRAMSGAEILHRLNEAGVRRAWRRRQPAWDESIGDGPIRSSRLLRERLHDAASLPGIVASAQSTRSGHLQFLGRDWPRVDWSAGAGTRFWLHDPVTARLWPGSPTHAFSIDTRTTGTDPKGPLRGDAKYVWEPGRLQFLHPLAAVGDARTALAILRDFAETNPPYAGIHWTSGIEIALRLASLTLVCAGCEAESFAPADRILIRRMAAAHAVYLETFPSLHSSANNHRMAEGLGLFLAGRLLPDIGGAWAAEGRDITERMALRLIHPDGGGAEQSPVYLAFTLEMLALVALLAAEDGAPLAAEVLERLCKGTAFLRSILDEAGHAPAIGDDDETRVIAQPPDREPRYVASIVAALAGLLGRPDLAPPDRSPHLRDIIFAAPRAAEVPTEDMQTFPHAGYTALRESIGERRVHLVFDHGPLGFGTLAAHGHSDALAVWLSIDGEPVLIDAGTWLYFSAGTERLRLRESLSHNSVSLHGASQSRASSAFGWSSCARTHLLAQEPGPNWSVTAAHDGYRSRFGLEHRRRIAREADAITIGDSLTSGSAPAEIAFLLPDALDIGLDGPTATISRGGNPLLRLQAPVGFPIALRRGAAQGAVRSQAFGEIEDAQRLVLSGVLGQAEAVTRFQFQPAMQVAPVARDSLAEHVSRP